MSAGRGLSCVETLTSRALPGAHGQLSETTVALPTKSSLSTPLFLYIRRVGYSQKGHGGEVFLQHGRK
jgi:hypothetical protein